MADEATINPDGSTTFEGADAGDVPPPVPISEDVPPVPITEDIPPMGGGEESGGAGFDEGTFGEDTGETLKNAMEEAGTDPVVYLLIGVAVVVVLYYFFVFRKKDADEEDDFFSELDGEKFNLKLPAEVEEYYKVKAKCEAAGWEPGKGPPAGGAANASQAGPYRILAQALMKRAIADIPMVTQIQKESAGMNRLYSQSMCSASQWRAYQAAEALVSSEVDEVRAEADEVEPGWSQAIWRQAMQYHNMLKQRHEMEAKAAEEQAQKRKQVEQKVDAAKKEETDAEAKERAAQKAAEELIQAEEREKQGKKAFAAGGGMKKGFLGGDKKKGKK